MRQSFPTSLVAVLAPETSVSTYQAAINNGLSEIFDKSVSAEEITQTIAARLLVPAGAQKTSRRAVQ